MKFRPDKKYFTAAVYAFGVVIFTALFVLLLANGGSILRLAKTLFDSARPILVGVCIAYILYPFQRWVEGKLVPRFRRTRRNPARAVSVAITFVALLALLALILAVLIPQIIASYTELEASVPAYLESTSEWFNRLLNGPLKLDFVFPVTRTVVPLPDTGSAEVPNILWKTVDEAVANPTRNAIVQTVTDTGEVRVSEFFDQMLSGFFAYLSSLAPYLFSLLMTAFTEVKNVALGMILAIYFLLSRERCLRGLRIAVRAVLPKRAADVLCRFARSFNTAFFGFIVDKTADVLVMFSVYLPVFSAAGIPYAPLVSLIMGVANFIPYVGPLFGAFPAAFIVLVAKPAMTVWFILIVAVLQALDLYFFEHKLLGERAMLSPVWVLVSISVMGELFGFAGFLCAVPVASVLYTRVRAYLRNRTEKTRDAAVGTGQVGHTEP